MDQTVEIGVISDTHGLLRPEALDALEGVDRIIHGGDVGGESILDDLSAIAPVTVVRGNTDYQPWAARLPVTEMLEVGSRTIYVVHDIEDLNVDPAAAGIDVVIYGHSHRPVWDQRGDGVWQLNPGSAGPRRFSLPVTVARLQVSTKYLRGEIKYLVV
ncbi:MAG: metallophosphoesterase family protein [Gemmatimonadetes bacterium]|nr:metallophosphoesterase family protein [Gemmatimonadota bacterium]